MREEKTPKRPMGRPRVDDPRIPLPFRLKTSIIEKAKRLGRDKLETIIGRVEEK